MNDFPLSEFLKSGALLSTGRGTLWVGWGGNARSRKPASERALSVYAPDFFLRAEAPWRIFSEGAFLEVSSAHLKSALSRVAVPPAKSSAVITLNALSSDAFKDDFCELKDEIARGHLKKAVPVVFRQGHGSTDAGWRARVLFQLLSRTEGFPLSIYGIWDAHEGMLGATPEILFEQTSPCTLTTMALAGTRPHGAADRMPLLEDPKELAEHRYVIDGIASAMASLDSRARVSISMTGELRLATLSHLHTPITVEFHEPVTFSELIRALHPTPALGAWPREAGLRWLATRPSAEVRGRFGAPFGMITPDHEQLRCVVSIRGVQWQDDELRLGAGCGVVAESRLEREWRELELKLDSIQGLLAL